MTRNATGEDPVTRPRFSLQPALLMRVLHLIDASSPQATAATLALLDQSLGRLGDMEQRTLILGPRNLVRIAGDTGVRVDQRLAVPFGQAVMGYSSVYRHTRDFGQFDVIHCWSVGSLALAALVFRRVPRVLTLTCTPSTRTIHWLRILTREARGRTVLLPISSTIRRAVLGGGMAQEYAHVLRPGIDMGRVDRNRRDTLRARWCAQSDSVKILALLGDPPHVADAMRTGVALNMAGYSAINQGLQLRLLIHPDQTKRLRAQKMFRDIGRPKTIIQEPWLDRPWSVLPGCDLALAMGPSGGGLSLLWAMAANVPVVGEADYAIAEIIEHDHSALLAQPGCARSVAKRITQLLQDGQLAWKLRDTARHEAYSFFSRQRYCQSLGMVYEQIIQDRPIEIPALETTGGLRFAGRG